MSKEINLEEVFAEIYVPINDVIKRGEHIFDYNDMMLFAKAVVKKLTIPVVVGTLPKCEHKNIDRQDGCDECLDCGVRNY